ncbi:MAG: hypothetical protein EBZ74_04750 [Planctomycetia bacterium]|nr:hypothetical protein [Planctomycetia bacterium]
MRDERVPATVVLCCGVPAGIGPAAFRSWIGNAAGAGVPVAWVTAAADAVTVRDVLHGDPTAGEPALAVDAALLASRPALRREIAAARVACGGISCAVAAGTPALDHRPLLVEQGIRVVAVGGFDRVVRSSRRPAPAAWACRSLVWGLWEVRTAPDPLRSAAGRLLPWAFGPRPAAGSLCVVNVDTAALGPHAARTRLERLVGWIARRTGRVRAEKLSQLPDLLAAAGRPRTDSVLRAAA